jgi:hypothetical protein
VSGRQKGTRQQKGGGTKYRQSSDHPSGQSCRTVRPDGLSGPAEPRPLLAGTEPPVATARASRTPGRWRHSLMVVRGPSRQPARTRRPAPPRWPTRGTPIRGDGRPHPRNGPRVAVGGRGPSRPMAPPAPILRTLGHTFFVRSMRSMGSMAGPSVRRRLPESPSEGRFDGGRVGAIHRRKALAFGWLHPSDNCVHPSSGTDASPPTAPNRLPASILHSLGHSVFVRSMRSMRSMRVPGGPLLLAGKRPISRAG